jgi:hypothetical protein
VHCLSVGKLGQGDSGGQGTLTLATPGSAHTCVLGLSPVIGSVYSIRAVLALVKRILLDVDWYVVLFSDMIDICNQTVVPKGQGIVVGVQLLH